MEQGTWNKILQEQGTKNQEQDMKGLILKE